MDILYLLVPLSVLLVVPVGMIFWWALRGGQFDDMEGPAHRILMDDEEPATANAVDLDQISPPPRA